MKVMIPLAVALREPKEKLGTLRRSGTVPGVIYGSIKNTSIQCSVKDLTSVYVKAGENTLIEVDIAGKKVPCLIHAMSFDPVTDVATHVDLYAVDMTKKVTTHIPVVLKGESPAVKTQGGVLVMVHSQLEVTCLPADLPSNFVVDISTLENFRDAVMVSSLVVPQGVVIKNSPETMIVTVQEPRKEEVVAVAATTAVEGAAPADGAAAAPGAAPAAGAPAAAKTDEKAGKEKAAPAKK